MSEKPAMPIEKDQDPQADPLLPPTYSPKSRMLHSLIRELSGLEIEQAQKREQVRHLFVDLIDESRH